MCLTPTKVEPNPNAKNLCVSSSILCGPRLFVTLFVCFFWCTWQRRIASHIKDRIKTNYFCPHLGPKKNSKMNKRENTRAVVKSKWRGNIMTLNRTQPNINVIIYIVYMLFYIYMYNIYIYIFICIPMGFVCDTNTCAMRVALTIEACSTSPLAKRAQILRRKLWKSYVHYHAQYSACPGGIK